MENETLNRAFQEAGRAMKEGRKDHPVTITAQQLTVLWYAAQVGQAFIKTPKLYRVFRWKQMMKVIPPKNS